MEIEVLAGRFSVCKVADYGLLRPDAPFCFTGKTDAENSLVCREEDVPANATARDDGWRGVRIVGTLDFSLVGILAGIAHVLARAEVGIFAISTYDTDYVLMKEEGFERGVAALEEAGYDIRR